MQHSTYFFVFFILTAAYAIEEDYYWRDYNGTIPSDAFSVGTSNKPIYVGQGIDKDEGIFPGSIRARENELMVTFRGGVRKMNQERIKILCGPARNFYWVEATADNAHLVLLEHRGVVAGHETSGGVLGVGRIPQGNGYIVGKVITWIPQDNSFHYADNGRESSSKTYEILCYQDRRINPRSPRE